MFKGVLQRRCYEKPQPILRKKVHHGVSFELKFEIKSQLDLKKNLSWVFF